MPESEKRPWKLQSEKAKEDHFRKYPGYVYRPRRAEPKKGAAPAATKGNSKSALEKSPPARRMTVHENPVWSVSLAEDALEQPTGAKRSAPVDAQLRENRKRQRMSEPSMSAISPPPPPPPDKSGGGRGIMLPTIHMDDLLPKVTAFPKPRKSRSKASVSAAPRPPSEPLAQNVTAQPTQPESGNIVQDLRRRHSVYTRNSTPSSNKPSSLDVVEVERRPSYVEGQSQSLHYSPPLASMGTKSAPQTHPSMPAAAPGLPRSLSHYASGPGHSPSSPPRLSTFGPPAFSPVVFRTFDQNTVPARPPSPSIHPLQPITSSSHNSSRPSPSTSKPMASSTPPDPFRSPPSPAHTSSRSPVSQSPHHSHSRTPTSSISGPAPRSRPRTHDDVLKDLHASASYKHQQRMQAIRDLWAASRGYQPCAQRVLGERIPLQFRQFHEEDLEKPTCYGPVLRSGSFLLSLGGPS